MFNVIGAVKKLAFSNCFGDTETSDMSKTVSRHFSTNGHNGVKDRILSILEYIEKPLRSPAAVNTRDRVEPRLIHLPKLGMNIED